MRRIASTMLATVVLPTLLVASFGLFMTSVVHRLTSDQARGGVEDMSQRVADFVGRSFNPALSVAHGVHAFWLGSQEVTKEEFGEYAEELFGLFPEVIAIEWVDPGNVVRYVYPAEGANAAAIDFDNNPFPNRLKPILDAKASRQPVMTRPVLLAQGFPGVIIYDPIFRGDEYLGAAVVVVRLDEMRELLRNSLVSRDYDLIVASEGMLIVPGENALFVDGTRVTAPDGSGVRDARAPRWPDDAGPSARSAVVADRVWNVIAIPKRAGNPVTTSLIVVTVGMTLLCAYIFAAIRQARLDLERAVGREREFTSLVSHQLRAPLTELNWMTDVLAEPDTDPATRATTLTDMRTIIRQGVKTVNMLLSISRIERGVLQVKREDVLVAAVVEDAVVSLREQAKKKGVTFNIDVAPEHSVHVDHSHAVEALRNIIDNAVKYGPEKRAVTVSSRDAGGFVAIDVTDHGNGVPEGLHKVIFEKATGASGKGATEGAGLGLYLTRMLAELMDGDVSLRSKPGETVFTLRLPRSTDAT